MARDLGEQRARNALDAEGIAGAVLKFYDAIKGERTPPLAAVAN